jgi:VWFA-related protein
MMCVTALLLHSTAVLGAQDKSPSGPSQVFRVTTELVQFDAVVVDSQGRPVTSLTREDFEIRQDDRPVAVRDVTFVARRVRAGGMASDPDRTPRLGIDVEPLVYLIDDMAMTLEGFHRVRTGLRELFARGVPAGVEVGILRTGERGYRTTVLTADRDQLLKRIDGMRYLARSTRRGVASASGAAGAGTKQLERTFLEGTLGSVNSLLVHLRRFPGRKTVVLLSEGVALDIAPGSPPVEARLDRLSQLAGEAGVTLHCVDLNVFSMPLNDRVAFSDGLTTMAARMAGLYLAPQNDLTEPLERIAAFERGFYLLSYEPPDGTFVSGPNPPFRRLSVRVRRDDLTVRTRGGFFGRR